MEYKIESEIRKDGSKVYYDIYTSSPKSGQGKSISPPHIHTFYEIVTVTGGQIEFTFEENEKCILEENDILIVYPNEVHGTAAVASDNQEEPKSKLTQHVVKFSPLFLYPMNPVYSDIMHLLLPLKFEKSHSVLRCGTPLHRMIHQLMISILEERNNREPGFEIAIRSHLSMIYTYLIRRLAILEDPHEIPSETGRANVDLIYKALNYVEEHYQEPISMQQVAQECNLNYYHFSRIFQQYTHQGFRDYVVNFRINKARKMLLQTNYSVTNVAIECGFETISYFIKKFQSVTGMTPKNFRKRYYVDERDLDSSMYAKYLPRESSEESAKKENDNE